MSKRIEMLWLTVIVSTLEQIPDAVDTLNKLLGTDTVEVPAVSYIHADGTSVLEFSIDPKDAGSVAVNRLGCATQIKWASDYPQYVREKVITKQVDVWEFVTQYYPNYSGSDEITRNDDLRKILDGEDELGSVARELRLKYDNFDEIKRDYYESQTHILEAAIEGYLKSNDSKLRDSITKVADLYREKRSDVSEILDRLLEDGTVNESLIEHRFIEAIHNNKTLIIYDTLTTMFRAYPVSDVRLREINRDAPDEFGFRGYSYYD